MCYSDLLQKTKFIVTIYQLPTLNNIKGNLILPVKNRNPLKNEGDTYYEGNAK